MHALRRCARLVLLQLLAMVLGAAALDGHWELLDHVFAPRDKFALACWDDKALVFGGRESGTTFTNSIFLWDQRSGGSDNGWEEIFAISAPAPRFGMRMHRVGDRVLVFGGNTGTAGDDVTDALVIHDIAEQEWRAVPRASTYLWPSPRSKYASVLRKGTLIVFFGGLTEREMSDEVWELDTQSLSFSRVFRGSATGAVGPSARFDSCCDYVDATDTTVCFGGTGASGDLADVWAFSHATATWTRLASTGDAPSIRRLAACGIVGEGAARGRELAIIGGYSSHEAKFVENTTLHAVSLATGEWRAVAQDPRFAARDSHAMCRNDVGVFVMGGAANSPSRLNDVWQLDTETLRLRRIAGTSRRPQVRQAHSAVVVSDRMYIFFGARGPALLGDTWALNLTSMRWAEVLLHRDSVLPRGRAGVAAVATGRIVMAHGGKTAEGFSSELLSFDTARRVWSHITQNGELPAARAFHQAARLRDNELVFIGGQSAAAGALADIFVFSLQEQLWKRVTHSEQQSFEPRRMFGLVQDAATGTLLIIGGISSRTLLDRWRLSHPREDPADPAHAVTVNLTRLPSTLLPGEIPRSFLRSEAAVAGYGNRVVVCGGAISASFPMPINDRCYEYNANTGLNSRISLSPVPAFGASGVYFQNKFVLFGGQLASEAVKREVFLNHVQIFTVDPRDLCPFWANATPGTVAPSALGDASCIHCAAGSLNPVNPQAADATCAIAARGSFVAQSFAPKVPCPAGKFNAELAATSATFCQLCPAGSFSDAAGVAECLPCTQRCRLGATGPTDVEAAPAETAAVEVVQPLAYEPVPVPLYIFIILGTFTIAMVGFLSLLVLLSVNGQAAVQAYYMEQRDVEELQRLYERETVNDPLGLRALGLQKVLKAFRMGNVPTSIVEELFRVFDVDGSGFIGFGELQMLVTDVYKRHLVPPREGTEAHKENSALFEEWAEAGMTAETKPAFRTPRGILAALNRLRFSDLDFFSSNHNIGNVGDPICFKRTTAGGLLTLVFFLLIVVLVAAIFVNFFFGNMFETRGTIPEVALDRSISGGFRIEYKLASGAPTREHCVSERGAFPPPGDLPNASASGPPNGLPCARGNRIRVVDPDASTFERHRFGSQQLSCVHDQSSETCEIHWVCRDCTIDALVTLRLEIETNPNLFASSVDFVFAATSGITPAGQATEADSVVRVTLHPTSNATVFRGHPAAAVALRIVPTLFETIRSAIDQRVLTATGHHAQVLSTAAGHEVSHDDYNQFFAVPMIVFVTPADYVLFVSRKPLQTVLQLITSILGSLSGLSGVTILVLRQFDGFMQRRRNRIRLLARQAEEEQLRRSHLAMSMSRQRNSPSAMRTMQDLITVGPLVDAGLSTTIALAVLELSRRVARAEVSPAGSKREFPSSSDLPDEITITKPFEPFGEPWFETIVVRSDGDEEGDLGEKTSGRTSNSGGRRTREPTEIVPYTVAPPAAVLPGDDDERPAFSEHQQRQLDAFHAPSTASTSLDDVHAAEPTNASAPSPVQPQVGARSSEATVFRPARLSMRMHADDVLHAEEVPSVPQMSSGSSDARGVGTGQTPATPAAEQATADRSDDSDDDDDDDDDDGDVIIGEYEAPAPSSPL